jgi:hypothetical protein
MTTDNRLVRFQGANDPVELRPVDYSNGFKGWHGLVKVTVEGMGAVDYHLDLMKLEDFRERGYRVDSDGQVRTFKGGSLLVLAPFQD